MTRKKKQPEHPKDSKQFFAFLCKLHERLQIMLDYNITQGADPIEEDVALLGELYDLYDTTEISWLKDLPENTQVVRQGALFADKESEKK